MAPISNDDSGNGSGGSAIGRRRDFSDGDGENHVAASPTVSPEEEEEGGDGCPMSAPYSSEGYTPLDDLGLLASAAGGGNYAGGVSSVEYDGDNHDGEVLERGTMIFSFGAPGSPAAGGREEMAGWSSGSDDGGVVGGIGSRGGSFFVNPAAFEAVPHMNGRDPQAVSMPPPGAPQDWDGGGDGDPADDPADPARGDGAGDDEVGEAELLEMADRALRTLDEEYAATLRAGGDRAIGAAGEEVGGGRRSDGEAPAVVGAEEVEGSPAEQGGCLNLPSITPVGASITNVGDGSRGGSDGDRVPATAAATTPLVSASEVASSSEGAAPVVVDAPAPLLSCSDDLPPLDLFAGAPRPLPPVNSDAVRRAVSSIRLKSPSLAAALDTYTPQNPALARKVDRLTAPRAHPIIPRAPLAAWGRDTDKAVRATDNLSRSATLAEVVRRCCTPSSTLRGRRESLIVHVLGCDSVECASDSIIKLAFGPFVRWIGAMPDPPRKVRLALVGPNVGKEAEGWGAVDLLPPRAASSSASSSGGSWGGAGLERAEATCHDRLYHEYLADSVSSAASTVDASPDVNVGSPSSPYPDLIVAFDAGIWGYDSWVPTLEAAYGLLACPTPFVVTAYTIQEAEDDAEVIEGALLQCGHRRERSERHGGGDGDRDKDGERNVDGDVGGDYEGKRTSDRDEEEWLRGRRLWPPEPNPFGSRRRRETKTAPTEEVGGGGMRRRQYRENAAWQAWTFGGNSGEVAEAKEREEEEAYDRLHRLCS